MTDRELVTKKLAEISTYLHEIETLAHPERIEKDVVEQRFLLYSLQVAIQAALDVASHIISDGRLGEPETYRELFEILARHGWLDAELAGRLSKMAKFRNVIVHGYGKVDLGIVRQILDEDLEDLRAFIREISARVS